MSETNHRPVPDILNQAVAAQRASAAAPAGPPADLAAATGAAVEERLRQQSARVERRKRTMKYVRISSFATAAAVLVAVGAGLLVSPTEAQAANFKTAMENAAKAKTMTLTNVQVINGREMTFRWAVSGPRIRMDMPTDSLPAGARPPGDLPAVVFSIITDGDEGRSIQLNHPEKTAVVQPVRAGGGAPGFPDLVEGFRRLRDEKDITLAGREPVSGKPADKFTMTSAGFIGGTGQADVTVWIDPKTNLPVKVVVKAANLELRFDDFRFDDKLADGLFSVEVPKGYTVKPAPKPPEPSKPADKK